MPASVDHAPRLRTLGGLELTGAPLSRPKPLLLLAYVALEGRQPRRHLAELLFSDAEHPLQSLAVALSRLRRAVGAQLHADERTVATDVQVDTAAFLVALEGGDLERATAIYGGAFLEGVAVDGIGAEAEEWIYATREFLAEQLREARLRRAEREAIAGRLDEAGDLAERAWETPGAPAAEPSWVARVHGVLLAAGRVLAARVANEAREWGVELSDDREAARERFASMAPRSSRTLPVGTAGFVGRARERLELRSALLEDDGRVVVVIGPGGVGKTQLAIQVAHDLEHAEAFSDGVHFVALEDVNDPGRVPGRVAHALGVTLEGAQAPEERLARALRDRRALVVLDNAEGVLDGAVAVVRAAAQSPGVRWLVTSRERLELRGEVVLPLGGLDVPPAGATAPAVLRASDAVHLFLQRARRVRGTVEDESLVDVARICHAVGGWPLALEIAASLTRVMPPAELADELERRLDLLVDGGRDVPSRHHSVLGTLESTWERLGHHDRLALARLTVFRGGFTLAHAQDVADVGVARIARLVDRSLVRHSGSGRYELHPLVWRYAHERLEELDDANETVRAHSRYFLGLLVERGDELGGSERDAVAGRLWHDHANLRDAWRAAVREGDDEAWGAAALAFGRYLAAVNRYREGVEWLGEARKRARLAALDDEVLAVVALHQGSFIARVARFDAAARAIAPAITALDATVRAMAHETLASEIEFWRGRYAAAGRHLREAETLYNELGDVAGAARCAFVLANIHWVAGDWDACHDLLWQAREAFRGLADRPGEVLTTAGMGLVEIDRGDLGAARRLLDRAAERAQGLVSEHLRAMVEVNLVHVRLLQGEIDGAAGVLERAVGVFERVGDDPWVAEAASYAAVTAAREGRADDSERSLAVALEAALRVGHLPSLAAVVGVAADLAMERAPDDAATLHEIVRDHPETYATTRRSSAASLAALGRGTAAPEGPAAEALIHPGTLDAERPPPIGRSERGMLEAVASALLHDRTLPSGHPLEISAAHREPALG